MQKSHDTYAAATPELRDGRYLIAVGCSTCRWVDWLDITDVIEDRWAALDAIYKARDAHEAGPVEIRASWGP